MNRFVDLVLAVVLLLLLAPVLAIIALAIVLDDGRPVLYRSQRVGRAGRPFPMCKFRTMYVGADRSGVMSTAADDRRISRVGHVLRRYKLDELPQLLNIIRGDMSFVGPRPNVESEVRLYSAAERELLSVRPGITDLASIVFSDEGDVLRGSPDPNRSYNLLIRPWKSELGLHYVRHRSPFLNAAVLCLTAVALFSIEHARRGVSAILRHTGADPRLQAIARRAEPLVPLPPPGVSHADWELHLTYQ